MSECREVKNGCIVCMCACQYFVSYRSVDICLVSLLYMTDDLLGRRVDSSKGLATFRIDKLVVDEQASFKFPNIDECHVDDD
jgi:hypothetical protein